MRDFKRKNKGITLVALVVTIIILLILAGITISQLTNSGLLNNAKLAKVRSEEAGKLENETLEQYESEMSKYIDGTRSDLSKTVLYPNESGELKNEPQTISVNKRIEIDSPYPNGKTLYIVTEIYQDGIWGETGWIFDAGGNTYGVKASKIERDGVDKIVIRSGNGLRSYGSYTGYGFEDTAAPTSAPYRLKIVCLD